MPLPAVSTVKNQFSYGSTVQNHNRTNASDTTMIASLLRLLLPLSFLLMLAGAHPPHECAHDHEQSTVTEVRFDPALHGSLYAAAPAKLSSRRRLALGATSPMRIKWRVLGDVAGSAGAADLKYIEEELLPAAATFVSFCLAYVHMVVITRPLHTHTLHNTPSYTHTHTHLTLPYTHTRAHAHKHAHTHI